MTAGDITARFAITGPSISRHLSILKGAGLVTERRDANRIYYALVEERLANCIGGFLSAVCPSRSSSGNAGTVATVVRPAMRAPGYLALVLVSV